MPDTLTHPETRTMSNSSRYWLIRYGYPGEVNGIDAASEATGLSLVGLVDENAGGIVGYIAGPNPDEILDALNDADEPRPEIDYWGALEDAYNELTDLGVEPNEARSVLNRMERRLIDANPERNQNT